MEPAHAAYLLFAIVTHGVIGYALARGFTDAAPPIGALGAVAPDLDLYLGQRFVFPFVHRGITHTLPFAAFLVTLTYVLAGRRAAVAVGLGVLSHLLIDTFTATGIAWFYPLSDQFFGIAAGIHGVTGTVALWGFSIALLVLTRHGEWENADGAPVGRWGK